MSDRVRLVRSPTLAAAPYAYAAAAPAGSSIVALAGSCPLDAAGETVAPGDPAAQAVAALDNLEVALAEVGGTLLDVLATRVLVATANRATW